MRKTLLALAVTLFSGAAASALPVTISPLTSFTVYGGYLQANPIVATFSITNTGTQSLTLGLERQVISEVPGSENSFCFSIGCYPPPVGIAPDPLNLAAGATDNSFVGDYIPNGYAGITRVRYAIYDQNGTGSSADTAYVTITYDASRPSGTPAELAASPLLGSVSPNPVTAGADLRLSVAPEVFAQGGTVSLVSLTDGRRVHQQVLRPLAPNMRVGNNVVLPTSGLAAGLYGCLLQGADGSQLALRRVVVQ